MLYKLLQLENLNVHFNTFEVLKIRAKLLIMQTYFSESEERVKKSMYICRRCLLQ